MSPNCTQSSFAIPSPCPFYKEDDRCFIYKSSKGCLEPLKRSMSNVSQFQLKGTRSCEGVFHRLQTFVGIYRSAMYATVTDATISLVTTRWSPMLVIPRGVCLGCHFHFCWLASFSRILPNTVLGCTLRVPEKSNCHFFFWMKIYVPA